MRHLNVKLFTPSHTKAWDAYVHAHPRATLYHLSGWKNVIEKTYGHKTYYLMAMKRNFEEPDYDPAAMSHELDSNRLVGILPLVHLKHFLVGNSLVSLPFFDLGGILADHEETEGVLLAHVLELGKRLGVNHVELRNVSPLRALAKIHDIRGTNPKRLADLDSTSPTRAKVSSHAINASNLIMRTHKVRMLKELPNSSESLWKSFKSKLRSQIRKSMKEGVEARIGGRALLDHFYHVFSINMRDLGSPLHSKKMVRGVLEAFPEESKIVVVYKNKRPVACSLVVGFHHVLENPWASALREYSKLAPNMLLYWSMLEYACDNGYTRFDFGRSTPYEGTYRFKLQWGTEPHPLYWTYLSVDGKPIVADIREKWKFERAISVWKKSPVGLTKVIGPRIRKYVAL
jgi:FemAB-related protein (PEP-CTERM system-associated)